MLDIIKETLDKAIETMVEIKVIDRKVADLTELAKEHGKRIAALEATHELNIQTVKVAFLEAKEQLRLLGSKGK